MPIKKALRFFLTTKKILCHLSIAPVSYTHLDVYKRQQPGFVLLEPQPGLPPGFEPQLHRGAEETQPPTADGLEEQELQEEAFTASLSSPASGFVGADFWEVPGETGRGPRKCPEFIFLLEE